jgi:putative ABC transport system permease protein
MLRTAFHGMRGRKGPFAGAFVALAIAAALVTACGTLLEAGLRSDPPVERYAGAPLVIAGSQQLTINPGTQNQDSVSLLERVRVPAALVPRLAAVPGVRAAIADVSAPARLLGPDGVIAGPTGHPTAVHPWDTAALTPYWLESGRAPLGARDLVLDAGLARRGAVRIGQRVRVSSNGPAQTMTVVGIARTAAGVPRQGVMFVTRREAERLAATPGRVDAIGILPAPGVQLGILAARLQQAAGPQVRVVTGSARGEVEHVEALRARASLLALCGTFGGLALLIAMFVVASTLGLSVVQREREVALLRAIAATPAQVRRMIASEAVLVAVVASAVGVAPGIALAGALGGALARRGIAPEDMHVAVGVVPAIAAIAGSIVIALVAVLAAGRRAARVQPTRALQESSAERSAIGAIRLLAGLVALGGAGALLATSAASGDPSAAADTATVAAFALVLAAALLGPILARLAAGVLGSKGSTAAFLGISNVGSSSRRFASAMSPLVLSVAMSCLLLFVATTRDHAASEQGRGAVSAEFIMRSEGAGIPMAAVAEVRRIPGVKTAVGLASTTLGPTLGETYGELPAAVFDPHGIGDVLNLDVRSGSLSDLDGGSVALSTTRAAQAHAGVGRNVSLTLGDGTRRTARVVAIYRRALAFGDVLIPTSMAAGHRTSPLLESVLVRVTPGASRAATAARLSSLATRYPGLSVADRRERAVHADTDRAAVRWVFEILAAIVFIFTAIAVVNTLMMIGLHRTRELALLRLVGATNRQVRAMARWEAGLVVGLGVILGAAIALVALMPTSRVLSGSPIPYAPPGLVVLVLGSAAAVGLLGSELSTRLAIRSRAVDAIGLHD